jgi:GcrA cell cycle regulator
MTESSEDQISESLDGESTALLVVPTALPDQELTGLKRADGNFVTTLTLNSRTCKWPIGDPTDRDFHYCGRRPGSGRPYCDAHELRSYQPLRSRANQRSFLRSR